MGISTATAIVVVLVVLLFGRGKIRSIKVLKRECLMIHLQIIKMRIQSQIILTPKTNNQNASNWMLRFIS